MKAGVLTQVFWNSVTLCWLSLCQKVTGMKSSHSMCPWQQVKLVEKLTDFKKEMQTKYNAYMSRGNYQLLMLKQLLFFSLEMLENKQE